MEIALFHRKPKKALLQKRKALKNVTRTTEAVACLADQKRQQLLQQMRELSGLETTRYASLCSSLIDNLVLYCQKLPETNNSYYSHAGGLVDHALNRTEAALSLFQAFMLLEGQILSEMQLLWQYALFSAAILQNIGSLFVDYKINTYDVQGEFLKQWNPLAENLFKAGNQYDYELLKEPDTPFRHRLNLLLAKAILPKSGFSWIASNPQVLMVWLALLNEDAQGAGILGALLIRADAIALQRYFSELMDRTALKRTPYGHAGTFIDGALDTLVDKEQIMGLEFLQWLAKALEEGKLILNKGPLIMVSGGLLLTQELFQLFVKESNYKNWETVQKGFLALGLYVLGGDGRAILRFEAQNLGMVTGILFSKYAVALPASLKMTSGESISAIELIHKVQQGSQYTQKTLDKVQALQKLNPAGEWLLMEPEKQILRPGAPSD